MSRKSRLREKATHHYQGDDPLLEKSIEQAESAASAKLSSEAINLTSQTDAMGGISKESLTSMASTEEMSRKPKKKNKKRLPQTQQGFCRRFTQSPHTSASAAKRISAQDLRFALRKRSG